VTQDDRGQATTTASPGGEAGFTWHPVYAGKTYAQVQNELANEIARDQRAYKLAMDGAEASEHDSLITVVELERRWSEYEFDWSEMDAKALAQRIVKFEQECERRRERLSFADYRASGALLEDTTVQQESSGSNIPVLWIGIGLLVILIVVFLLITVI
jgi:hypothetical protein